VALNSTLRKQLVGLVAVAICIAAAWRVIHPKQVCADGLYFALSSGNFSQDWSNIELITAVDDWSGVPSIIGYRGDDLTTSTGTNPGTITGTSDVVDVNHDQTAPNTFITGGVAEFHLTNPTVALTGSGTADAPYVQIHLNATGRKSVRVAYTLRDLEDGADNAIQQVALQFRTTGAWINVPAAYIDDATSGPNTFKADTPVAATLPDEANDAAQLQVRIITTNAVGNDEWVGVDDIVISSDPCGGPCPTGGGPPTLTLIHEIQGAGRLSPLVGQVVTTQGIVTARARNGFFLQSSANETDASDLTSQGIFVFTNSPPPAVAAVGDKISLTGTVAEFGSLGGEQEAAPTVTELTNPGGYSQLSDGELADLPAPIPLSELHLSSTAPFDMLERFEGMRVSVPQTIVVAPTKRRSNNSDGQFFVTLPSAPKPYREAGIEAHVQLALNEPATPQPAGPEVPRFDTNPEVLRIDTDELFAYDGIRTPAINAAVGATVAPFTAVLHFEDRTYSAEPTPNVAADVNTLLSNNVITPVQPLPAPSSAQFTIAAANLEFFSSTGLDYAGRKQKVVRAICDVMRAPDILGVIEVADIPTLDDLVSGAPGLNLNTYSGCNGATYKAYLDNPDNATQNTAFLVKEKIGADTRVTVSSTSRISSTEGGIDSSVNDRRPYLLTATVSQTGLPSVHVTVIVNHLRSLIGVDDPVNPTARDKKKNQSQYLASLVQRLQTENPAVNIALVGDFNSFQFNEGYVDVLGTIAGTPEPDDAKTYVPGDNVDLLNPDLVNLVNRPEFPSAARYTYNYLGDRQALDHILVNQNLFSRIRNFAIAHPNAEYPELDPSTATLLREDPTRPERYADHDVPVAYFALAEGADVTAQMRIASSDLTCDQITQNYSGTITITNLGTAPVSGPINVELRNLSANITVVNAAGMTANGPYLSNSSGSLGAGESITLPIQLLNSSTTPPTYTPRVYSGAF